MHMVEGRDGAHSAEEDALHDVLNIEREAQAIIADAEAQSERIVSEARSRARSAQARAEYEARADSDEDIQTALRYAEQATRSVAGRVEQEIAVWEDQARARLDETVDWVVRRVTLAEAGGDADRS